MQLGLRKRRRLRSGRLVQDIPGLNPQGTTHRVEWLLQFERTYFQPQGFEKRPRRTRM